MPLVRKLTDPASGISGAAATALGKIGDKAALPSLAAAAQLGPPPRQLAAMEALGRLSDPSVTEILGRIDARRRLDRPHGGDPRAGRAGGPCQSTGA